MASRNRISMSGLHKLLYILSCYHYNIEQHLRKILITVSFTTHLSMCPSSTRKNWTSNLRSRNSSDNRRAWRLDKGSPRCVAAFVERLLMNWPSGNPAWLWFAGKSTSKQSLTVDFPATISPPVPWFSSHVWHRYPKPMLGHWKSPNQPDLFDILKAFLKAHQVHFAPEMLRWLAWGYWVPTMGGHPNLPKTQWNHQESAGSNGKTGQSSHFNMWRGGCQVWSSLVARTAQQIDPYWKTIRV